MTLPIKVESFNQYLRRINKAKTKPKRPKSIPRQPRVTIEDMGEIFELRQKGVSWENLGIIFNVHKRTLTKYYRRCEEVGFAFWEE